MKAMYVQLASNTSHKPVYKSLCFFFFLSNHRAHVDKLTWGTTSQATGFELCQHTSAGAPQYSWLAKDKTHQLPLLDVICRNSVFKQVHAQLKKKAKHSCRIKSLSGSIARISSPLAKISSRTSFSVFWRRNKVFSQRLATARTG